MVRYFYSFAIVVFLSVCLFSKTSLAGWKIQQITNNDYHDRDPVLTDSLIGWLGRLDATDDVFAYDGTSTLRLTNNGIVDQDLSGSAGYLAWIDRGTPDNVYVYDGVKTTQVTTTGINFRPMVSGHYVVFTRSVNDIFIYDLSSSSSVEHQIVAGASINEHSPYINGNWVSFTTNEGDSEIYYHDIALDTTTKLTNNALSDYESAINDNYIAYVHYDGNDREVMVYDRATPETRQLTDDNLSSSNVTLSDSNVAYVTGQSSNDAVLSLYDAVTKSTVEVANNVSFYYDERPSMDGDFLVYMGWDGNDWEIYVYQISSGVKTQLTNNNLDDRYPRVHKSKIVWQQNDNINPKDGDNEIMLAIQTHESSIFFPIKVDNGKTTIIHLPGN